MNVFDMVKLMCENTAKLASLSGRKGAIKPGYDADFVIWDPDVPFEVFKLIFMPPP
jgi:allantoinase